MLVIGATGHFGARICRRLARLPQLRLIIASRSRDRAEKLVDELHASDCAAQLSAVALDQDAESFTADLQVLGPFVTVHTAGPYQGRDYCVAEACVECGSHYVDLADGREFVCHFDSLDSVARERGVQLIAGASTLPALSDAVISDLATPFSDIESVEISIAPAHQTPRGGGTVGAVLSYCGQPIRTLREGQWRSVRGWQDLRFIRYPRIGRRIGGACDVPDLGLLPDKYPTLRSVSFHAALEAPWEQAGLWLMASLTRVGLVRDWQRFVPSFRRISDRLIRMGSDIGGMHVRLRGTEDNGHRLCRTWYVTAYNNFGPEIPCTPAIIMIRKLLRGTLTATGAGPCTGLMTLDEFREEVRQYAFEYDQVDLSS